MEKSMLRKTLLVTLLIVLLSACAPQATPTPAMLTFTDGLGREITLNGPAQRVVSLAPSTTEVLFAIGAGAQVVGRDDLSDFPTEAQSVASIGSTFGPLNTEAILALEPDLVVAAEINTPEQVKTLEDLGITVYYFKNPVDFDGLYKDLGTMGTLTGHEDEAAALVESLSARVEAVEAAVANLVEKPTVFYEIDGTDPAKPWTTGPGTFMDIMITKAGGVNIGGVLSD
jgi:iron complex transport system substrate-binding protein